MLLVTGITGHSGRWFVQRVQKENFQGKIRCLVRSGSDTAFFDNCAAVSFDEGILEEVNKYLSKVREH